MGHGSRNRRRRVDLRRLDSGYDGSGNRSARLRHGRQGLGGRQCGRSGPMLNGFQILRRLNPAALNKNFGLGIGHDDPRRRRNHSTGGGPQIFRRTRAGRRRCDLSHGGAFRRGRGRGNLLGRLLREERSGLRAGGSSCHRRSRRLRRRLRINRCADLGNARDRLGHRRRPRRRQVRGRCGFQLPGSTHGKRRRRGNIRTGRAGQSRGCRLERSRRKTDAKSFALGGVRIRALWSSGVSHNDPFYSYFGKCSMAKFAIVTYL
jgi:hypothetical protein